jgi:glycosyltransferase involved in cell wall biosynthesis
MPQRSALIVRLVASAIMDQTIPSKVQGYLAAGRPVIASMNGEGARVVQESRAGLAYPAGDAEALAQAVSQLADLPPTALAEMGEAALRYYEQHFEPRMLSRRLIEMFHELRCPGKGQSVEI